ncbi:MAG: LysM peptidoglycan-binding domain-containing protein [Luteolibacter sp.]
MFFRVRILAVFLVLPLLTQCGSQSAPEVAAVTGPFDSNGNYREDWVNSPEKWYKPTKPSTKKDTETKVVKRVPAPAPVTPVIEPKVPTPQVIQPQTVVVSPKPAPPKPKPKPKPPTYNKHKVVRGDNLTKLARRYSSSVALIKKANNLKSDVIMLGQTLKIPR